MDIEQVIEQLKICAKTNEENKELNCALEHAIGFIIDQAELPVCEVPSCKELAEYEGWYRCKDPFLGTPSGLIQRRQVCEFHTNLLIAKEKENVS